ncbi:unnamed protein product [Tetraodon nigroviridis]|uniref:Chromosome 8 SCAF14587, whole genome shotgun sequence n=1 Tax=Tetraodon nigroviridis TaxID=99883 RepID=Q4SH37_TETNG|nr:unnamed protein product [Tetraodon nigroviridis]
MGQSLHAETPPQDPKQRGNGARLAKGQVLSKTISSIPMYTWLTGWGDQASVGDVGRSGGRWVCERETSSP